MDNLTVCVQEENANVSPKDTIESIYKAGFKNVFVQYYRMPNLEFDEISQIDYCRKLGLNIDFCHLGYKDADNIWLDNEIGDKVVDEYIQDLELMHEKGIDMVCMHAITYLSNFQGSKIGLSRIRRLVEHAKKLGIKIAFENTKQKDCLEYILENIKDENVGVCFDAGHYNAFCSEEPNWSLLKNRIFCVHLHDNDKTSDQHLIPGEGTVNWTRILNKLKELGYKGPLSLELCYRNDYLNMSLDEFYKKGYESGKKLEMLRSSLELDER